MIAMMRWLNLSGLGWALGLTLSVSVVNTGVAQRVCGLPAAAVCGQMSLTGALTKTSALPSSSKVPMHQDARRKSLIVCDVQ